MDREQLRALLDNYISGDDVFLSQADFLMMVAHRIMHDVEAETSDIRSTVGSAITAIDGRISELRAEIANVEDFAKANVARWPDPSDHARQWCDGYAGYWATESEAQAAALAQTMEEHRELYAELADLTGDSALGPTPIGASPAFLGDDGAAP